MSADLKIRRAVEELAIYSYAAVQHFPKAERHVLSQELRSAVWRLLRLVVVCNRRYFKKTTMQDLDAELDLLRSLVRVSHRLGYTPLKRYEIWSRHLDDIGRMVGGWLRSLERGVDVQADARADRQRVLEQRRQCRGLRPELQQRPGECELEHRVPPRSRGSSEVDGSRAVVQHAPERVGAPRPRAET